MISRTIYNYNYNSNNNNNDDNDNDNDDELIIDDGVVEEHVPYVLTEGVLEKSTSRKDTFLRITRRLKPKWKKRYFVLRCGDVPDQFYLDQYTDASPTSRIRKTLDMERVSRVDTNVSSNDDNKNWIFSIHFSTRSDDSSTNSIHLAAESQVEMDQWVAQLCYACKLEKQEDIDEPYGTLPAASTHQHPAGSLELRTQANYGGEFRSGSLDSFVETPSSESSVVDKFNEVQMVQKNNGNYSLLKNCGSGTTVPPSNNDRRRESMSEEPETESAKHPYIHLKNCTSTRPGDAQANTRKYSMSSFNQLNHSDGSSSSIASDKGSVSTDSDSATKNEPPRTKSALEILVPPPRPPKGRHLNNRKDSVRDDLCEINSNYSFHLDQRLPPPQLDEIGIGEDHSLSGETIKTSAEECDSQAGPSWEAPLPCKVSGSRVFPPLLIAPLPAGDGVELIPPKVDRSCKPHRKAVSADETNSPTTISRINSFVKRYDKHSYSGPSPPILPRKSSENINNNSSTPFASNKAKLSIPTIPKTNPLHRIPREPPKPPAVLPKPQISSNGNMLEYFDPVKGITVMRSTSPNCIAVDASSNSTNIPVKIDTPSRIAHSVEYVLIDEQSTKAVYEANTKQNELRATGKLTGVLIERI